MNVTPAIIKPKLRVIMISKREKPSCLRDAIVPVEADFASSSAGSILKRSSNKSAI